MRKETGPFSGFKRTDRIAMIGKEVSVMKKSEKDPKSEKAKALTAQVPDPYDCC